MKSLDQPILCRCPDDEPRCKTRRRPTPACTSAGSHSCRRRHRRTWGIILAYMVGKPLGIVIDSRAFDGAPLDRAKAGILAAAVLAPAPVASALAPPRRGSRLPATSTCPA